MGGVDDFNQTVLHFCFIYYLDYHSISRVHSMVWSSIGVWEDEVKRNKQLSFELLDRHATC